MQVDTGDRCILTPTVCRLGMEEVSYEGEDIFWDACSAIELLDRPLDEVTGVLKDSGNDDLGKPIYSEHATRAGGKRKV